MRAVAVLVLLAGVSGALGVGRPLEAQAPVRRLAVARDASVRILNLTGSIHVIGWDRDSVTIGGSPPRGGGTLLAGGSERGVKIVVEAEPSVDVPGTALEIRVPRTANLWVKSASATITIENVVGEVEASSVTGAITISGTPAVLVAESMEGDIDIAAPARVSRAKTAGGDITLREAAGEVTATSVSGAIRLLDARGITSGRVESVSGGVTFNGGVAAGGSLDLQTHDAPIEIFLPAAQGAVVDVAAYGGKATNRIPGLVGKPTRGKAIQYVLGDGGARVTARSLKGDVSLRQRMPRPNPSP